MYGVPQVAWVSVPAANGMRPMCSTPAPITMSATLGGDLQRAEVHALLG